MTSADPIKTTLAKHGPMRSSRLAGALADTCGLSHDAAKKRVSRVSPPIRKFPIRLLPKNEAFLYHEDDRNSERFWDGLVRDLRESGSIYGLAIDGLMARGGLAQRASFNVVSGSPEAQKKQVPLSGVLDNLVSTGLVERFEVGEMGKERTVTGRDTFAPINRISRYQTRNLRAAGSNPTPATTLAC